jgi:hypothetical protein
MRLHAVRLVGIVRTLTAPETRALVAGLSSAEVIAVLEEWLRSAARLSP